MADDTEWKSYRDAWYNDRVMETYISAPIVDKQNDLVPTKTMEDAMDFYMKYGVYSFQHEEQPIGLPLAWKTEDGKVKIKVGIHSGLEMHDHAWKEIKAYGLRGASSIRGEATEQKEVCEGEVCHNEINELGLWSVSWVEDHPANPEATVTQVAAMAKGEVCKCGGCGKTESGETLKYNTQELESKEVDSMTEEKSDPEVVAPEDTEEVKEEEETVEEEKQDEDEEELEAQEEEEDEELEASDSKKDLGMVREALMAALDYLQEGVEAMDEDEEEMEASDDTEKEELTLAKSLKVLKRNGFNVYSGSKTTPAPKKIQTPKAKFNFDDLVSKSWDELDRIERGM